MCQAMPGKLVEIHSETMPRVGSVDFDGLKRRVNLDCLPEAKVGDYVIVHAGFAINLLDQEEALRTLDLHRDLKAGS